jgi:hypothetical protein
MRIYRPLPAVVLLFFGFIRLANAINYCPAPTEYLGQSLNNARETARKFEPLPTSSDGPNCSSGFMTLVTNGITACTYGDSWRLHRFSVGAFGDSGKALVLNYFVYGQMDSLANISALLGRKDLEKAESIPDSLQIFLRKAKGDLFYYFSDKRYFVHVTKDGAGDPLEGEMAFVVQLFDLNVLDNEQDNFLSCLHDYGYVQDSEK